LEALHSGDVSGCRDTEWVWASNDGVQEFRELCARTAQIKVLNEDLWAEYLSKVRLDYEKADLDSRTMSIRPADGFEMTSTVPKPIQATFLLTFP
jgi:hypothetical protein